MLKVTIKDDFFGKEFEGIFETVAEAIEFYSVELDTFEENIHVIQIETVTQM